MPPSRIPRSTGPLFASDQPITRALMIPLGVVVRHEFMDGAAQRGLTDQDHSTEALVFDRAHKALCVRVQVSHLEPRFKKLSGSFFEGVVFRFKGLALHAGAAANQQNRRDGGEHDYIFSSLLALSFDLRGRLVQLLRRAVSSP